MQFSIVTPSFNRIDAISRAIGSVAGQNGIVREHIVQDNRSTDGTAEFLADFEANSSLLRANSYTFSYESENDKGMYDAINRGWSRASGDILSWLNCDEQYLPGTLGKVQAIFNKHPDVGVVYGNAIIVDAAGSAISARREIPMDRRMIANTFLNIFSCATFFRRSLWDRNLLRLDNSYRYAADMELVLRLLREGVRTHYLDDYLSLFQADESNLSRHGGMQRETVKVQELYGASSVVFRKFMRLQRWGKRLFRGCYLSQRIEYEYALDEVPNYRPFKATCGGTFRFK